MHWRSLFADILAAESGNLLPWAPVFMGAGIAVYFSLPDEPQLSAVVTLSAVSGALTALAWRYRWRIPALLVSMTLVGFLAATLRTDTTAAPRLEKPLRAMSITATVDQVFPGAHKTRVILTDVIGPRLDVATTPARLRITVRPPANDLAVGNQIRAIVSLRPPPPPIMPQAYDFQRQAYFDGIGAYGFTLGTVVRSGHADDSPRIRILRIIDDARRNILARALAADPGDQSAAVAAALLTGYRGFIDEETLATLRDAGIAHLLAISGLHIGLIAGLVFAAIRAAIALLPRLAQSVDGKKIAAASAVPFAAAYAVLAGFTVPTERALIMTTLVLAGILLDRRALSMRTVAFAALTVLLFTPESLVTPGFQMSFAAVTALIAVHSALRKRRRAEEREGQTWVRRVAGYFAGVMLMSIIASAATAPFAVYHFQHVSTFGIVANIVAVPIAAFWVMPAGLAGTILIPFGLDQPFFVLMAAGTDLILTVARIIAALPITSSDLASPPVWVLVCIGCGGILLSVAVSGLRYAGVPLIMIGSIGALMNDVPDIIVDGPARAVAVKDADSILMLSTNRKARFETAGWRRRSGETAPDGKYWPETPEHSDSGLRCDAYGCLLRRRSIDIAIVTEPDAIDEDCRGSDFIIALEPVPRNCGPPLGKLDWFDLWLQGTHAIWIRPDGTLKIESVNGVRGNRPWVAAPSRRGKAP